MLRRRRTVPTLHVLITSAPIGFRNTHFELLKHGPFLPLRYWWYRFWQNSSHLGAISLLHTLDMSLAKLTVESWNTKFMSRGLCVL